MTLIKNRWLALALLFAGQCAVIGGMFADRVRLRTTGREIVLDVAPVDPRDLFRGDYVRLGYAIGRVPDRVFAEPPGRSGSQVYVVLKQDEAAKWQPVRATASPPGALSAGEVTLRGSVRGSGTAGTTNVDFVGISSYFVPEGAGLKIEKQMRDRQIQVRVSVDRAGNAAIKGLSIDGVAAYTEPAL